MDMDPTKLNESQSETFASLPKKHDHNTSHGSPLRITATRKEGDQSFDPSMYSFSFQMSNPKQQTLLHLVDQIEKELNNPLLIKFHRQNTNPRLKKLYVKELTFEGPLKCLADTHEPTETLTFLFFWGKARSKTMLDISEGKSHLNILYKIGFLCPSVDLGDDPFESKKWCKLLSKGSIEDMEEETESCFSEECPIYREMKEIEIEKEKDSEKKEPSLEDLWHFSEYFHGDERRKPMCTSSNCRIVNRLANGGYSRRDLRHTIVFRHDISQRKGSMLRILYNPLYFPAFFTLAGIICEIVERWKVKEKKRRIGGT